MDILDRGDASHAGSCSSNRCLKFPVSFPAPAAADRFPEESPIYFLLTPLSLFSPQFGCLLRSHFKAGRVELTVAVIFIRGVLPEKKAKKTPAE